jgi:hypothetical protein
LILLKQHHDLGEDLSDVVAETFLTVDYGLPRAIWSLPSLQNNNAVKMAAAGD